MGSDGEIGSALLENLPKFGFKVSGTSRNTNSEKHYLNLSRTDPLKFGEKFDFVIIAAEITSNFECTQDPQKARKINLVGTLNICDYFLASGAKVIFFLLIVSFRAQPHSQMS